MSYIPSLTLPAQIFATPAVSILLPVSMGFGMGYAVMSKKGTPKTYLSMKQPPFSPPSWVFGPAWTTLYTLMGYSAYRAWTAGTVSLDSRIVELTKQGATLYTIQLGLNMLWTPLFFGMRRPIAALVDIVFLWGTVAKLIETWSQVDAVAGYCLVPYLGWLTFATYLNAGVGYLNDWDISDKKLDSTPTTKSTKSANAKKGN